MSTHAADPMRKMYVPGYCVVYVYSKKSYNDVLSIDIGNENDYIQ